MKRRSVRSLTARVLAASVALGGALLLSTMSAGAAPDDPLLSGDPRATAHSGNIGIDDPEACAKAGLEGEVILSDANPSGTSFDLPEIPEGFTLTGVVVKGGPGYNVYAGSTATTDLHAPLGPNGEPAGLSHWFACGTEDTETTTTDETTTDETTTDEETTGNTTTSGGAVSGGSANLPDTGASVGSALLVAGALLLVGGGLVVATRRRAFNGS